jgi:C-terminal processing protease CtpA/Prc
MKSLKAMLLVLGGLAVTPLAARADHTAPTPKTTPAPSAATGQPSQEQLEQQLEQARQQLQEAAHRVADLSMQLNGDAMRNLTMAQTRLDHLNKRGFLGVDLDDDDQDTGVSLDGVTPGGPAAKAGLREGDVITGINGTVFKASGDDSAADKLNDFMRDTKPGDSLKVAYTRDGKPGTANVTAGSIRDAGGYVFSLNMPPMPPMPPMAPMAPMPPMPPRGPWNMFFNSGNRWGEMQLVTLTPAMGQYFGTDKGLLVMHMPKDSKLQLQEGDVILQVGGRDPGNPPHAMRILSSYGPGENVKLDIMRKGKPQTLNVTLPKSSDDDNSSTGVWVQSDDAPAAGR